MAYPLKIVYIFSDGVQDGHRARHLQTGRAGLELKLHSPIPCPSQKLGVIYLALGSFELILRILGLTVHQEKDFAIAERKF